MEYDRDKGQENRVPDDPDPILFRGEGEGEGAVPHTSEGEYECGRRSA